jgi:putative ABC transport system ATP-binding protein
VSGVELCGASAAQLTRQRRNHSYIFQAHNLHESLTALQNVKMGLELHSEVSIVYLEDGRLATTPSLSSPN